MRKLLLLTFLLFCSISFAQTEQGSTIVNSKQNPPSTISNVSASPNPLTVRTSITFKSTKDQKVTFTVKNLLGKIVYEEQMEADRGYNKIPFNRNNITKGMYIYSIQTESEIVSKRLVIR